MYIGIESVIDVTLMLGALVALLLVPAFFILSYGLFKEVYKNEGDGISYWLAIMNLGLGLYFAWTFVRSYRSVIIPIPTGFGQLEFLIWHLFRLLFLVIIFVSAIKLQLRARRIIL